jgi:hypothetical protein
VKAHVIYKGSGARVRVRFTNPDTGVPVAVQEPVTIRLKRPDGSDVTEITGTAVSGQTGTYDGLAVVDQAGTWEAYAISSDAFPAVTQAEFEVHDTVY